MANFLARPIDLPPPPPRYPQVEYNMEPAGRWLAIDWHGGTSSQWNEIRNAIKALPQRRYNGQTKKWLVPATEALIQWLKLGGWGHDDDEGPSKFVLPDPVIAPPLDQTRVLAGLYPYQVQFLRFSQGKPRLCLWDGMGVGKTVQALAWIRYQRLSPVLIICNSATKLQWKENWERWLKDAWPHEVKVLTGKTPYRLEEGMSYIINWDILTYWQAALANHRFRGVVADEAQAVGERSSKRTKAFMEIAKSAPFLLAMSGTPARSRPVQLWPVLNCINQKVFADFFTFAEYFGAPKETPFGRKYPGASHAKQLHAELQKIAIRRLKEDVLKDLPKKTRSIVPMETDASLMREYEASEESVSGDENAVALQAKLESLSRSAYNAKESSVKLWLQEFLESGEKLVVFAWHRAVVEDLMEFLNQWCPVCLYGGMSEKAREMAKEQFVTMECCKVIVANIQSGGVGIDGLQKVCSNCCFVECSVTPADHDQAEDRLCRIGQELPVTCHYLIARDTIDEDLVAILDRKANTLSRVIDGHKADPNMLLQNIMSRHSV